MADTTLNRVNITIVRAYITLERIDINLARIVWYHPRELEKAGITLEKDVILERVDITLRDD